MHSNSKNPGCQPSVFFHKRSNIYDEPKFKKSLSIRSILRGMHRFLNLIGSQVRIHFLVYRNRQASSHHLTGCKRSNTGRNRPFAFRRFLETTVHKIHEEWTFSTLDRFSARPFILAASLTSIEAWDRCWIGEYQGQGQMDPKHIYIYTLYIFNFLGAESSI